MIAITAIERPHINGPECWCHPAIVECTCGQGCGTVYGHSEVEIRPDVRPRMAVFSEQIPFDCTKR